MTLPTLTYGNGFEESCQDASVYTEVEDGCTATLSVVEGGIFDINVTGATGNKVVYYHYPDEGGADNIGISSNTYKKITFRYKTSSTSIKAKIVLVFSSGNQTVLAETSSVTWAVATVAVTADKTIDHIRFYATQATGHVYYQFALIHKGTFTFPDFRDLPFESPKRLVRIPIPGRGGDILQDLGSESSRITVVGDMQHGETWGSANYPYGEYFLANYRDDTFAWFTSDMINCLVVVDRVKFGQEKESGQQRTYRVEMTHYTKSDQKASTWDGLEWLGK